MIFWADISVRTDICFFIFCNFFYPINKKENYSIKFFDW